MKGRMAGEGPRANVLEYVLLILYHTDSNTCGAYAPWRNIMHHEWACEEGGANCSNAKHEMGIEIQIQCNGV